MTSLLAILIAFLGITLSACSGSGADIDPAVIEELAPTGSLRVAIAVAPAASTFFSTIDEDTGEPRGAAVDLGAELAAKLGVPVSYVIYPNSGELTEGGQLNEWDVAFMPRDDARAAIVDFGAAYNLFESTFIVRPGSPITSIEEVDREGVRVAVIANTTTGRTAERYLQQAVLLEYRSVADVIEALRQSEIDAAAMGQASLRSVEADVPGSRVLGGSFHATANSIAVPKGNAVALAYVTSFIEEAKASGSVRRAFDRLGLTDAVVAPPEP